MSKFTRLLLAFTLVFSAVGMLPGVVSSAPVAQSGQPEAPDNPQAYLPVMLSKYSQRTVSGQVTDTGNTPLQGVSIQTGDRFETVTGADGKFTVTMANGPGVLVAEKEGYQFSPSILEVGADGNQSGLNFVASPGCADLLFNGGFENDSEWLLENAAYTTAEKHSGVRALQLGNMDLAANAAGTSSATSQELTIPNDGSSTILHLWVYPRFITEASMAPAVISENENFLGDTTITADTQFIQLVDASTGEPLDMLLETHSNRQEWSYMEFDLGKWAGKSVKLRFGAYNDGLDDATALLVEDVALRVCPQVNNDLALMAPSAIAACSNLIQNSGFEFNGNWGIPHTAYTAGYSTDTASKGTTRSMRTGIPFWTWHNVYSYSDAWQDVFIPSDAVTATLWMDIFPQSEWWGAAPQSGEEENGSMPEENAAAFEPGKVWGETPLYYDTSYILILNPYNGVIRETLRWKTNWDKANWQTLGFDLRHYRGQHIRIQFGTFNDGYGDRQVFYVDEVYVDTCTGVAPPPLPPPTSTLTCTVGTQRLVNPTFEANSGWYIPATAYSAGYSTAQFVSPVRSMRTGINNYWRNRFSYSDFGQFVTIPYGTTSAKLRFSVYRQSTEPWIWGPDVHYLLVLNPWGYWIDTLYWQQAWSDPAPGWTTFEVDVTRYAGWTIRLHYGTYNNGWYGVSAMWVDDATLCTTP